MTFLIQQTMLYAVPLMIGALAGGCAERSGIINLALEGIMIFGAFVGVLFVRSMQDGEIFAAAAKAGDWITLQGLEVLAMLAAAAPTTAPANDEPPVPVSQEDAPGEGGDTCTEKGGEEV